MRKSYSTLILSILFISLSYESTAANLTMNQLAGPWVLKKKIIENGDIPLDAHGFPSGKKVIITESCEITPVDNSSGRLRCGDELLQINIEKKKLTIFPLTTTPEKGFIDTLKEAWLEINHRIYDSSSSQITSTKKELQQASPVLAFKAVPLNIVNKKKITNGTLRVETSFTGEYCTSIRDRFGSIQLVKCSPLTAGAAYEVKYLSLTR